MCGCFEIQAQSDITDINVDSTKVKKDYSCHLIAGHAIIAASSLMGLNELWYKKYPRSSFHFFNDGAEWLQMDKAGHIFTSYQISRIGHASMLYAGKNDRFSTWYALGLSTSYMTAMEILDGYSTEWGFSLWDFGANTTGAGMFAIQELLWKEQRIVLKYSYHNTIYPEFNGDLLGTNMAEKIIKDYNGQTYWFSVNPSSFMKSGNKFPWWLNIAFGYGAEGMIGGHNNQIFIHDLTFQRERQFYLSPDIDLTKIKTRNKFLEKTLFLLNFVKIPAPAIEINGSGKSKFHILYF